jgi:hypothetical protein
MLNRTDPDAALAGTEIALLDQLVSDAGNRRCRPGTLAFYLTKLARLGGYLARAGDPPPGIIVIWRGLSRLTDIELGAESARPALWVIESLTGRLRLFLETAGIC